jgi:aryl-alcohol dehydrogenase-like predicted oxidoreductase
MDRVVEIAEERSVVPAQVALSWLLHQPVVAPIVGATKPKHVEDALAATELTLSDGELERLSERYETYPIEQRMR